MSDKVALDKPPESPTTARELDFDDDNEASNPSVPEKDTSSPPASKSPRPGVRFSEQAEEIPPQKPPRPVDPNVQAQNTLIEAFPGIDTNVVKAVLVASGGKVEPAFNALLSMSDPSFKSEEAPPPQPPRPQPRSQLEQDEMYARQLAEHYESQSGQSGLAGHGSRTQQSGERRSQPYARSSSQNKDEREYSFFEDDLPEIRKNIEQGFQETQKTVNKWITSFKKKLDGEPDDYDQYGNPVHTDRRPEQSSQGRQNFGPSQSEQLYGIRKSAEQRRSADMRRSADHNRYDADNRVLADDFEQLEMRDNDLQQKSNSRPSANPDLFKPTPVSPPQSGPVDEVDAIYRNPSPNNQGKSASKKWQPLTSIAPHPETDDHDPFSLGDSDDEDSKTKDTNPEDTERLKKAAEAKAKEGVTTTELKPATRSGSVGQRDAAAEALLRDAK